jgi:hypothetical protein
MTLRARHAHCAITPVLKSAVLLPFSIASVLTAFALPHGEERFALVASPATATIAAATTQTISVREPESRCHTVVHFERIDGASLPLHASAWLYSSAGAQPSDLPAAAHAIATRTLVFVTHPHRTVSNLSREQRAALLDGSSSSAAGAGLRPVASLGLRGDVFARPLPGGRALQPGQAASWRVLLRAVDGLLAVAREFCSKVGGGGRGGLINCQYVYYCYYYDSL